MYRLRTISLAAVSLVLVFAAPITAQADVAPDPLGPAGSIGWAVFAAACVFVLLVAGLSAWGLWRMASARKRESAQPPGEGSDEKEQVTGSSDESPSDDT